MHTVTPLYSCFVYQTTAINFPKILYIVLNSQTDVLDFM